MKPVQRHIRAFEIPSRPPVFRSPSRLSLLFVFFLGLIVSSCYQEPKSQEPETYYVSYRTDTVNPMAVFNRDYVPPPPPPPPEPEDELSRWAEGFYSANCRICHRTDGQGKVGPGLKGVEARMPKGDWKYAFIWNSDSMRVVGDPYTQQITEDWGYAAMPSYPDLTRKQIDEIYRFIRNNVDYDVIGCGPSPASMSWTGD